MTQFAQTRPPRSVVADPWHQDFSEQIRYAAARLLGLRLISDVHERASELGIVLPVGKKRRKRLAAVQRAGMLFVHVPKNAGQSVSEALYRMQIRHNSIRYYRRAMPDLARLPSFAILRDPADRFLSAYHYGLSGGQPDNRITHGMRRRYMRFRSVDDALDHVEAARSPYEIDHIFRPQSWYVTDETGAVAVDRLLPMSDLAQLSTILPQLMRPIGRINCGGRKSTLLSPQAEARVRRLYAADYTLFDSLPRNGQDRADDGSPLRRTAH
ncbi:sulfotransferase family 2 domain-containing protein [Sphingomonas sp. AP4-R1]|uniref:sulfotransferase family 2 domain-containing protein n=1 Tax=Sphingomonas sp. AP4-R1 TaxID=2735134 RepID=UPI0014936BD6|nr:sulfotransferase family 2 domain-containing protein [Sphingomonas sp. AP4-R1]QJU58515.1 sulfotransferase family 2 domain-containing protein [Sphingomonas sp. AP4-R1]